MLVVSYYRSLPFGKSSNLHPPTTNNQQLTTNNQPPTTISLRSLLPVVLCLSLLVGVMLLYCGNIALSLWHPNLSRPNITSSLPPPFDWASVQQILLGKLRVGSQGGFSNPSIANQQLQLPINLWPFLLLGFIVVALLINPQFWLSVIAVVLSLFWSWLVSEQWGRILQYFHPEAFRVDDPLFGQDISAYVFKLPVWQLLNVWLGGMLLFGLVAVALIYLLSADSLSQGKFPGFSANQLSHLYGLGNGFAVTIAGRYWLKRYELLYSPRGIVYGASYTDVKAELPIDTALSLLAVAIALFLLLKIIFRAKPVQTTGQTALATVGLYVMVAALAGGLVPAAIQRLSVQPNELARERPYIQRTIALTRAAFALNTIESETFNPQGNLTSTDLAKNDLTIRNIRLWDKRPILRTNRQLQRIRLYYEFADADIDRYNLKEEGGKERGSRRTIEQRTQRESQSLTPSIQAQETSVAEKQQVLIAARELNYEAVPQQAKTWVNKHLVYTHGYGFTLSPVNTADEGGLPTYFVKDIGTGTVTSEAGGLSTSSQLIRDSIPIGRPRIYYGELSNTYVMTSTKVREFDYPSGEDNVYNTYDGKGGIAIDSLWRRILFAQYLKDWQMLLTRNFTPQTRLLFRRNINQRLRAIAPFLRYDRDPYIVTANPQTTNKQSPTTENYLYWIVDAYTTSDRYPYSDSGNNDFNYIRNSVKVVIDAYHGDLTFYVADPEDPIIQSWAKIFPSLFKPLDIMPAALKSHIRYPVDLFAVQSQQLLTYHMTDPQVFYNREDLWQVSQEIYGGESRAVEPYYLIMKLPTATSEEFILLLPYTPATRTNLISWLAARSDGEQYGKLLLYKFPKQELVYGPEQIEALINQDPIISGQISLWNRQGSRAIQGNLLVIPIERSLLYVEPLYLEAEQNSLPTLVRVIVVYKNRIVMAETLEKALQGIFEPEQPSTPTIIRPLEEQALPLP
ncbi:MAG TPA: hypothetical protein DDZ80_09880 [Cyanobacteria bacterium UBA8803]|nr:hypothetical protein [Cyanobacteria bacterium UBA8803]